MTTLGKQESKSRMECVKHQLKFMLQRIKTKYTNQGIHSVSSNCQKTTSLCVHAKLSLHFKQKSYPLQ